LFIDIEGFVDKRLESTSAHLELYEKNEINFKSH